MRVIGDAVAVTVEDDGVGIDAALKAAPQDEPAGFGLDLLRERLDYLGGQLQVSSDADHGTRVSLTLPLRHCSTPTPAR
jgi:signal transduction histidine kinase